MLAHQPSPSTEGTHVSDRATWRAAARPGWQQRPSSRPSWRHDAAELQRGSPGPAPTYADARSRSLTWERRNLDLRYARTTGKIGSNRPHLRALARAGHAVHATPPMPDKSRARLKTKNSHLPARSADTFHGRWNKGTHAPRATNVPDMSPGQARIDAPGRTRASSTHLGRRLLRPAGTSAIRVFWHLRAAHGRGDAKAATRTRACESGRQRCGGAHIAVGRALLALARPSGQPAPLLPCRTSAPAEIADGPRAPLPTKYGAQRRRDDNHHRLLCVLAALERDAPACTTTQRGTDAGDFRSTRSEGKEGRAIVGKGRTETRGT